MESILPEGRESAPEKTETHNNTWFSVDVRRALWRSMELGHSPRIARRRIGGLGADDALRALFQGAQARITIARRDAVKAGNFQRRVAG